MNIKQSPFLAIILLFNFSGCDKKSHRTYLYVGTVQLNHNIVLESTFTDNK
jgi:hypothetical protein